MSRRKRQRAAEQSAPSTHAPSDTDARRRLTIVALVLGAIALIAYSNSFVAGLTLDNRAMIEMDPRVHTWSADTLQFIFTREYWWPEISSDLYRPLTTLSYWANYTLLGGGTDVTGYHVVNFALHWTNTILVLVIVNRLTKRLALAAIAAALFAVHPVNTEGVTNIVGRADLFATLAVLFGGWCYMRAGGPGTARRNTWLAATGVCAFVGVFAKETAVLIGVFMLLYDLLWRWPLVTGDSRGERLKAAWREFGAGYVVLVPAAVAFVVTRIVISHYSTLMTPPFGDNPIGHATWFVGFMTAWKVIGRYLVLLVYPRTLSTDYSYNQVPLYLESASAWQNVQAWVALGVVAALLWLAWRVRTRQPIVTWGILFLFLTQLPTSNLLLRIGSIMAVRFLYLPSIGYSVIAAYALLAASAWLGERAGIAVGSRPRVGWALAAIIVIVLGVRTHVRNDDWRDEISLWRSAMAASPSSFWVYKGYAGALLTADQTEPRVDEAIAVAERGLAIIDDPPLPMERRDVGMYLNLGVYYRTKGQILTARGQGAPGLASIRKSVAMLERAREVDVWRNNAWHAERIRKGQAPAEIADIGTASIYHELGDTYLELYDWPASQTAARYAQHLMPNLPRGYLIEGVATFYARHPDSAAVILTEALLLDPARADIWANLASCYGAMKQNAPVTQVGGQYRFDMTNPNGQQLVASAAAMLVARFEGAKQQHEARRLQERLIREYQLPVSAFSPRTTLR